MFLFRNMYLVNLTFTFHSSRKSVFNAVEMSDLFNRAQNMAQLKV